MKFKSIKSHIYLVIPHTTQVMNKEKIKLIKFKTMAKIASFRFGDLKNPIPKKIPRGERKRKTKNAKSTIVNIKAVKKEEGKIFSKRL
jgi:hypothetical protein